MAINSIVTALRDSTNDAFNAGVDGGAGPGIIEIWTSGFGVLLATLTFSDPAFNPSGGGSASAATILDDTSADANGTAVVCRFRNSTPVTQFEGTVGTSGADINFNTVTFAIGDNVAINSMSVDYPAG